MRFLSTRTHGYIDYFIGVVLIAAPFLLGFYRGGSESWVPILLGAAVILYSLFTNYELGMVKRIPMSSHLWLDGLGGAILALSPWLFGFADHVWVPHLLVGLVEIGTALMTRTTPSYVGVRAGARA